MTLGEMPPPQYPTALANMLYNNAGATEFLKTETEGLLEEVLVS